MTVKLHHVPIIIPLATQRPDILNHLIENLRYAAETWSGLELETWSMATSRRLEAQLKFIDIDARRLGWGTLRLTLADIRHELRRCERRDCIPDPAVATILQAYLNHAVAVEEMIQQDMTAELTAPLWERELNA